MILKINIDKKRNLKQFLWFYLILSFAYFQVISSLWVFRKLRVSAPIDVFFEFNLTKYIIGLLFVVLCLLYITLSKNRDFMYSILSLIIIFFVIPSSLIFASVRGLSFKIFFCHNLFFWLVVFFSRIKIEFPVQHFSIKQSYKILFLITAIGVIPFFFYIKHINLKNLFFLEVYKTREIFSNINKSNLYTAYTYSWFGRFIIPCIMVFSLYYKNKKVLIFSFFILIYLFLFGSHKSVLIGTFMVIFLYKLTYIKTVSYLLKILIIMVIVALFLVYAFDNEFVMVHGVRRALIVPALLDVPYFHFFDDKPLYWSQSFMGRFIEYPYDRMPPYLIGKNYFNLTKMASNNGLFSDGFMNAGMIGVIINIIIVAFTFSLLNQLNISNKFFGVIIWFFVVLMSSSLPTVILTHGGFVFVVLSVFFLKNTEISMDEKEKPI